LSCWLELDEAIKSIEAQGYLAAEIHMSPSYYERFSNEFQVIMRLQGVKVINQFCGVPMVVSSEVEGVTFMVVEGSSGVSPVTENFGVG